MHARRAPGFGVASNATDSDWHHEAGRFHITSLNAPAATTPHRIRPACYVRTVKHHVLVSGFAIATAAAGCEADHTADVEARLAEAEGRIRVLEERIEVLQERPSAPAPAAVPPAAVAPPARPVSRITIELDHDGLSVNGEAVAAVALRAELEAIAARSPDATVMIQAADDVPHAQVVETMDEVKKAGLGKIAMANFSDD